MSETGAEVVVCVGPGGVGKTTTAAAIALRGARAGRRACVVTIGADQTVTATWKLSVPSSTYAGTYNSTWTLSLVSGP